MDASWVSKKREQHEVRRQEILRRMIAFANRELTLMADVPDVGDGNDAPDDLTRHRLDLARKAMSRHRRQEMDDIRTIAQRMIDGTERDEDQVAMSAIMSALSVEISIDDTFGDDEGQPHGTLGDRLREATGKSDPYALLPFLAPDAYGPDYDRYLDETITLPRGNYVITDPCYLMRRDEDYADLEVTLPVFRMRDTLYGDWGCTTFRIAPDSSEDPVGRFCADAGLVCVADWDAAVAHNPEVASWPEERPWTMTVIRDFEGTATFEVTEDWGMWQSAGTDHIDYRLWHDFEMRVVLEGTHPATDETVRYVGRQTSL